MHVQTFLLLALWLQTATPAPQGQGPTPVNAQPGCPAPAQKQIDTSPQAVKEASQVIVAAAAGNSQKADDTLRQLQATNDKVDKAQVTLAKTNERVDDLVANTEDDDIRAQRREPADKADIETVRKDIENFRIVMDAQSTKFSIWAVVLLSLGLICGFASVVSSLLNKGTLSACLALGVIVVVALNSFLKLDTRERLYQGLAAAADSEEQKVKFAHLKEGQVLDTNSALSKMKAAAGGADTGDIGVTLQAFVADSAPKH